MSAFLGTGQLFFSAFAVCGNISTILWFSGTYQHHLLLFWRKPPLFVVAQVDGIDVFQPVSSRKHVHRIFKLKVRGNIST